MLRRMFIGNKKDGSALTVEPAAVDQQKEDLIVAIKAAERELEAFKAERLNAKQEYRKLNDQIVTLNGYIAQLGAEAVGLKKRFAEKISNLELSAVKYKKQHDCELKKHELEASIKTLEADIANLADTPKDQQLSATLQQELVAMQDELTTLEEDNFSQETKDLLERISQHKKALIKYLVDKLVLELKNNYLSKLDAELKEIQDNGFEKMLVKKGFDLVIYANKMPITLKNTIDNTAQVFLHKIFAETKSKFTAQIDKDSVDLCEVINEQATEEQIKELTTQRILSVINASQAEFLDIQSSALEPIRVMINKKLAEDYFSGIIKASKASITNITHNISQPTFKDEFDQQAELTMSGLKEYHETLINICTDILQLDLSKYEEIKKIYLECEAILQLLYLSDKDGHNTSKKLIAKILAEENDFNKQLLEINLENCIVRIKISELQLGLKLQMLRNDFSAPVVQQEPQVASRVMEQITKILLFRNHSTTENIVYQHVIIDSPAELILAYEVYSKQLIEYKQFAEPLADKQADYPADILSKMLLLALKLYYSYAAIPNEESRDLVQQTFLEAYWEAVKQYENFHIKTYETAPAETTQLYPDIEILKIIKLMLDLFNKPQILKDFPNIIKDLIASKFELVHLIDTAQEQEETKAPDLITPDLITPDLITPDLITPDLITPDLITPDLITPDLITPDLITPDLITPDLITPDLITPDLITPDLITPDLITPAIIISETNKTESHTPIIPKNDNMSFKERLAANMTAEQRDLFLKRAPVMGMSLTTASLSKPKPMVLQVTNDDQPAEVASAAASESVGILFALTAAMKKRRVLLEDAEPPGNENDKTAKEDNQQDWENTLVHVPSPKNTLP